MSLNGNIHIINPQVQCLAVNCSFYFLPIYNHLLLHHHTRSFSQSELIFSSHFTIFCFLSPLEMDRWMNGIKTRKYMHMKMWRLFFLSSNFSLIHNIFLLYFTFLSWNMWWDVVPYIDRLTLCSTHLYCINLFKYYEWLSMYHSITINI